MNIFHVYCAACKYEFCGKCADDGHFPAPCIEYRMLKYGLLAGSSSYNARFERKLDNANKMISWLNMLESAYMDADLSSINDYFRSLHKPVLKLRHMLRYLRFFSLHLYYNPLLEIELGQCHANVWTRLSIFLCVLRSAYPIVPDLSNRWIHKAVETSCHDAFAFFVTLVTNVPRAREFVRQSIRRGPLMMSTDELNVLVEASKRYLNYSVDLLREDDGDDNGDSDGDDGDSDGDDGDSGGDSNGDDGDGGCNDGGYYEDA